MASHFSPPFSDYKSADRFLNGKEQKRVSANSILERVHVDNLSMPRIALRLYNTQIVTYYQDGGIEINTGGFNTSTTKRYINGAQNIAHVKTEKGKLCIMDRFIHGNATRSRLWDGSWLILK